MEHRDINEIWNELKNHPDYVFAECWDKQGIRRHLIDGADGYLGEHFTEEDVENVINENLEEMTKQIKWGLTNNYNYFNPLESAQEQLDKIIENNLEMLNK
jgi:hypothetical protein